MKKLLCFFLSLICMVSLFCGCGSRCVVYTITVSGTGAEPGVISLLGYSLNVYEDIASNPCGDCADQPVHLYAGAGPEETASAIKDLIERMDDLWEVVSCEENTIVLREKTAGSVSEIQAAEGPEGLSFSSSVSGRTVPILSGIQQTINAAEFPSNPQRLAAVYGPSYELLVMLGAEDRIVVRADVQTEDFPWAEKIFAKITQLPVLKNVHTAVSFEELMTYEPDMVYTFPRQNELNQLAEAGVAALAGQTGDSLEDVKDQVRAYAATLDDEAAERAEAYCNWFDEALEKVEACLATLPETERKTVYYAGTDILTTYGSYSDIPSVIEAAGGIAVSSELAAGSRTQIDYEQLADWNPDVIFIDHGGMNDGKTAEEIRDELLSDSRYAALNAVKTENVYCTPSGVFYWDMGIQKILLVEYIAEILYPDYLQELDMEEELMDFYSCFYGYDLTREEAVLILSRQNPDV